MNFLLILALTFTAAAAPATAQIPILRWDDPQNLAFASLDVKYSQASDVDGDGFPEILIPHRAAGASIADIWVYSLVTQQPVLVLPGTINEWIFLGDDIQTVPDHTGDGLREYFFFRINQSGVCRIEMNDGLTGAVLWNQDESNLGEPPSREFMNIGDVNGDGIDDIFLVLITPSPVFSTFEGRVLSGLA